MSDCMGSVPFWRLAHSAFRHKNTEEEVKRANAVVRWIHQNKVTLEDILESVEYSFLLPIMKGYEVYGNSLTPNSYMDQVEDEGGKTWKLLNEMFEEYQDECAGQTPYTVEDLPMVLRTLTSLSLELGMQEAWSETKKILTSDPKIKVQGEDKMTRQEKAYTFLRSQLSGLSQKVAILGDNGNRDFQMVRDADLIKEQYIVKKNQDHSDKSIPIGLPEYDKFFNPQLGHFYGILGFSGHRKTTLGRTWIYNALKRGHKVAHFALEMGADDELPLYYLIHCREKFNIRGFSKKAFNEGKLDEQAEDLFYRAIDSQTLRDDLPGELFYRQRGTMSWFELAKEIDDLIEEEGITMVFCDYLTLVDIPGVRGDNKDAVNRMIQNVKPFCESRGILFVTPIQGNREGLDRCVDNEGQWDAKGVDTYSGYFRACDGILGVYSPKETPTKMVLSAVKNRHDVYPDPLAVNVCEDTGFIYQ